MMATRRRTTKIEPPNGRRTNPSKWSAVLLVAVALAAYSNSFDGAFVFDDGVHIVDNERIGDLASLGDVLSGRRPVVDLSLAVNHALGGLEVAGYHVVNLAIHMLATLTLWGVVRRTLASSRRGRRFESRASALAMVIALFWAVHPLQTQSVTYVIQRAECMMGLFYLLTHYCVVRGVAARSPRRWYVAAVASCGMGMGCKAVMVTAPLMVLLFDWMFLAGSLRQALRDRRLLYVGLAATWLVLWSCGVPQGVLDPSRTLATVGFGFQGITPLEYAVSQPAVIARYLMLALYPHPQCLDYVWPTAQSAAAIVPAMLLISVVALATVWALVRRSWLGFAGAWFLLVLAPTSSIVPIKDLMFEHRMYVSLAAVMVALVLGGYCVLTELSRRIVLPAPLERALALGLVTVITGALVCATYARNRVYHTVPSMWRNVIATRPGNARAYEQLGTALVAEGKIRDAVAHYESAVRIDPKFASARVNLANALSQTGRFAAAVDHYRVALELEPDHADAGMNLGFALDQSGRKDEAIEAYRAATRIDPQLAAPEVRARAHYNLGSALAGSGELDAALVEFSVALELNPRYERARFALGWIRGRQGHVDDAIRHYRAILEQNPDHQRARDAIRELQAKRGG